MSVQLFSHGNPQSELNIRRRSNALRDTNPDSSIVFVPKEWIDRNPAIKKAVEELDWLQVEKHQ